MIMIPIITESGQPAELHQPSLLFPWGTRVKGQPSTAAQLHPLQQVYSTTFVPPKDLVTKLAIFGSRYLTWEIEDEQKTEGFQNYSASVWSLPVLPMTEWLFPQTLVSSHTNTH